MNPFDNFIKPGYYLNKWDRHLIYHISLNDKNTLTCRFFDNNFRRTRGIESELSTKLSQVQSGLENFKSKVLPLKEDTYVYFYKHHHIILYPLNFIRYCCGDGKLYQLDENNTCNVDKEKKITYCSDSNTFLCKDRWGDTIKFEKIDFSFVNGITFHFINPLYVEIYTGSHKRDMVIQKMRYHLVSRMMRLFNTSSFTTSTTVASEESECFPILNLPDLLIMHILSYIEDPVKIDMVWTLPQFIPLLGYKSLWNNKSNFLFYKLIYLLKPGWYVQKTDIENRYYFSFTSSENIFSFWYFHNRAKVHSSGIRKTLIKNISFSDMYQILIQFRENHQWFDKRHVEVYKYYDKSFSIDYETNVVTWYDNKQYNITDNVCLVTNFVAIIILKIYREQNQVCVIHKQDMKWLYPISFQKSDEKEEVETSLQNLFAGYVSKYTYQMKYIQFHMLSSDHIYYTINEFGDSKFPNAPDNMGY